MSDDFYDKTRLIVARLDDETPSIVGAMSQSTWEIIPPEDWDKFKRKALEQTYGPDWTAYETIEVVLTFPGDELAAMFEAREIAPVSMEKATDA